MGYRIPEYQAKKLFAEKGEEEIRLTKNPYGYELNISHEKVNWLYRRYKKKHGIPPWCPLSDAERKDFEALALPWLKERGFLDEKKER